MLCKVTPILVAISLHFLPCFGHAAEIAEAAVPTPPRGSKLPLQRVDVYPTHAQALRSGVVGPTEYISGLSPGWKPDHNRLHINAPGPLIDANITNSLRDFGSDANNDTQLRNKEQELDQGIRLTRRELDHVQHQLDLLQVVGQDMPDDFTSVDAQALSQLLDFVSANDAALLAEEHRLEALLDDLRGQRRLVLKELNHRPQGESLLHLPGAAGSVIHVSEDMSHMRWAPSYRVEVLADGQVILHRDVKVLSNLSAVMRIPKLRLHALPKTGVSQPQALTFNRLGVSEKASQKSPDKPKQLRAVGAYGSSRHSESAVETSLSNILRLQNADGSWGKGKYRIAVTCLAMLSKLGGGYDHRTPNRYRRVVQRGLAFLNEYAQHAEGVQNQALVLTTYAELYAMTNDSAVKSHVESAYNKLQKTILVDKSLRDALSDNSLLSGPVSVALVSMALKSLRASGLNHKVSVFDKELKASTELLLSHDNQDAAMVALEAVRVFSDIVVKEYNDPYARSAALHKWVKKTPQWIQGGQAELMWLGTLVTFQHGGEVWQQWNEHIREYVLSLSTEDAYEITTLIPHHMGPAAAWSIKSLAGSVYYRYVPIGAKSGNLTVQGKPKFTLPNPQQMAKGWPLELELENVLLPEGEGIRRFAVDQHRLSGRVSHVAIPGRASGVWRVLRTSNSLSVPLATGPVDVIVDGRAIGNGELDFIAPREEVRLDLGLDNRFFVERHEHFEEREVAGRKVRTVTVEIVLYGPDGSPVAIEEAMPKPSNPEVRLRSLSPALSDDDLDRALRDDPQWRFELTPENGKAAMKIVYELRYPSQTTIEQEGK